MTREDKIKNIIAVLDATEKRMVDTYIDVEDQVGVPYYGISIGYAIRSQEYGVFTGDFLFVPLLDLSDESIELIWDRLVDIMGRKGVTIEGQDQNLTLRVSAALRDVTHEDIKQFLDDGMEHGTVVEALYDAFSALETGEARSIQEALNIGASEWYK